MRCRLSALTTFVRSVALCDRFVQSLTHRTDLNFDGRMSITGVNTKNVQYLAEAIHKVTNK